jgi:hypothetical protein
LRHLPLQAAEEEIKQAVRDWFALLAQGKYAEAASRIAPDVLEGSGSLDRAEHPRWTAGLLRDVIGYYGLPFPVDQSDRLRKVAPVDELLRGDFERQLEVERLDPKQRQFSLLDARYRWMVHAGVPLFLKGGPRMSDLTARFYLRKTGRDAMEFVLLDIHVM